MVDRRFNWQPTILPGVMCALFISAFALPRAVAAPADAAKVEFSSQIQPLFEKYCYDCHGEKKPKGDFNLSRYQDEAAVLKDRERFELVLKNVQTREMPPSRKPQPTDAERALITAWIQSQLFAVDCNNPDPGRVTIRRLNRAEYNNTIRDLVGVDFQPADDFPADDSGYGFDNIGDALSLSPVLLEKYLIAAEKILTAAIVAGPSTNGPVKRYEAEDLESTADGGPFGKWARALNREGEVFTRHTFPEAGEYLIRVRAFGQQAGPEPARMDVSVDLWPRVVFDVTAVESAPRVYELRIEMPGGEQMLSAGYINNYVNPKDPNPSNRDRNLIIDYLEVVGPIKPEPLPETHRRIFIAQPKPGKELEAAREIVAHFTRRAFRRPVTDKEVDRIVAFVERALEDGESFERSAQLALQAVLVSPHFLFRGELQPEPNNPKSVHPINEFALASRLSYFLWSSMPDEELFALAEKGRLRKQLDPQVRRMLKDPKARALVDNFAGQWLQLRNVEIMTPDRELFPEFDDELRAAMKRETELFFAHILRENRSVLEFLDADYTFANDRLARHYGLDPVRGDGFRRVSLRKTDRGGLLTHASILTITSNPTRTSPVKRGKWVLDNLLGTPPPPPPPEVPELEDDEAAVLTGSLRQRMEQHRDNPNCSSCHERMDPIGFGLENFDAIGGWRERDGHFPVDASGELSTGEKFAGAQELQEILLRHKREEFVRCLSEKLLIYALGRGMEYYDQCAIDQISKGAARRGYRFQDLILEVTKSTPFQKRRGEDAPEGRPVLSVNSSGDGQN